MIVRRILLVTALGLAVGACSSVGLGEQTCGHDARAPTGANVLAAQAVPTARYTPCISTIDPGWDEIEFEAESGRAGIAVVQGTRTFLAAIVTESCDLGEARPVPSPYPDIARYEAVSTVPATIGVTVIPEGAGQLFAGVELVETWHGVEVEERPVSLTLDTETMTPVPERVGRALAAGQIVWLVDELDDAENTVEMRTAQGRAIPKITPADALDELDDIAPEPAYRGNWYFVFDGGCITYRFDAEGLLAERVADVAEENLGFYPAYRLRVETAGDADLME